MSFFNPRNVCKKHPSRLAQRETVKAVRKQVLIFCDILVTYTVFQVCEELEIHVNKLSKIMTKFCFSEMVLTYSLLSRNSNHLVMKSQLIGSAMLQLVQINEYVVPCVYAYLSCSSPYCLPN